MLRPDLPAAERERLVLQAKCLGCGYELRGLTDRRCPECGRPFEPADLLSFRGDHTSSVRAAATAERILRDCWPLIVFLMIAMLWGGSAFLGGLIVAGIAWLATAAVLVPMSLTVNTLAAFGRRYAIVARPRRSPWLRALWMFSVLNLVVPVTVIVPVMLPLSPVRTAIVRLYTETPAAEAVTTVKWVGPMPIGPGQLQGGVFNVALGAGFVARVTDGDDGSVRVYAVPLWLRH